MTTELVAAAREILQSAFNPIEQKLYMTTESRYLELLKAEEKLRCRGLGGVTSWQWYDEAMEAYEEPTL